MEYNKISKLARLSALCVVMGVTAFGVKQGLHEGNFAYAAEKKEEVQAFAVTMSRASGVYPKEFELSMECDGAAAIYYTTDGSNPAESASRMKYENPIAVKDRKNDANYMSAVSPELFDTANVKWNSKKKTFQTLLSAPKDDEVDKGTVIKAVAQKADGTYGAVTTNTYFVGSVAEHIEGAKESAAASDVKLAVMSISVDYDDFFDYEKGIYAKGKIFDEALKEYISVFGTKDIRDRARNIDANYLQKGKKWERKAHIDFFETDGESLDCKLQQDCGIRIQGNYSRSDLLKGFRLYAREEYGKKSFKYPFFHDAADEEGKVIDKYKKIILRNGGNYAFYGTKYNDTFWQKLLKDTACETQNSRACVVYVNGEYWGLYILQQDYDDNYFEVTHGVNKDDVVVYKASEAEEDSAYYYQLDEGKLPEGETKASYYFNDLLAFFESHKDLVNDEDYKEFQKLVDTQSVMDYFAVNVWVNNKWDWPAKNWSMWRTTTAADNGYGDGRWRFAFYDMDFGGCGGDGEVYGNAIRDDNYNDNGLLGQNPSLPINPAVQCFILCMSNESFREDFKKELSGLSSNYFEEKKAIAVLDELHDIYHPLFKQFFARYYGKADAEGWTYGTDDGYAGYHSLKSFIMQRNIGISDIIEYIDDFYHVGKSSDNKKSSKKNINKLKVTAKKGTKYITVTTLKKAKVTITLKKKIILKNKKKVSKITLSANKKGVVKVQLSEKLKSGIKITVKVSKSGYKTKSINKKIK